MPFYDNHGGPIDNDEGELPEFWFWAPEPEPRWRRLLNRFRKPKPLGEGWTELGYLTDDGIEPTVDRKSVV